ncbi:hypothetical protein ACIQ2D_09180 [Lysinibacillus sp. NPDC097287]|uniref:hypothetical protein n=1 Tax=Lysinibacillus sp. NPDC097287 TaxID=3364144 RepID=UPI00380FEEAE
MEAPERSDVEGAAVTWTDIIADLEIVKDSIMMIGQTDAYIGTDWNTLGQKYADLVPYVILVEMNDPFCKNGPLRKGEIVELIHSNK